MRNLFFYDIEVFPNYFGVSIKHEDTGDYKVWRIHSSESQLLDVVKFFSSPRRTLVGFNSHKYDDQIIAFLLKKWKSLIKKSPEKQAEAIYNLSVAIIQFNSREHQYAVPYKSLDLQKILQVGTLLGKGLKLIAVNLKWSLIQDLPFAYNHHIQDDEVELLEDYNINDVEITQQLYNELLPQIEMRKKISRQYRINVDSESESGIGNRLFTRMYATATGSDRDAFIDLRTPRESVLLGDVIDKKVWFSTPALRKLLEDIRFTRLYENSKFSFSVTVGGTPYTLAKGGLHSEHPAKTRKHWAKPEGGRIIDADVQSYYPRIILSCRIKPAHIKPEFFKLFEGITEQRLDAKESGDKVTADALKITINAIFGKMGFEHSWLYDLAALYGVTLNGQLFLLMLIEKCEQEGIKVFYGNTDGITAYCEDAAQEQHFMTICTAWQRITGFVLEYSYFKDFFIKDVNNYLVVKEDGGLKAKGGYDSDQYKNLGKGFLHPVVSLAVSRFLIDGIDPEEVIMAHSDPYDFCLAQKVGKDMDVYYISPTGDESMLVQKTNRYIVSSHGGFIEKRKENGWKSRVVANTVLIANNMDELLEEWNGDIPINRWFYIDRAWKLIKVFGYRQDRQQTLFDA